ncbi:MAG: hypothetical protein ACE5I3_06620 [Phycisphaerae bacterium]
MARTKTGNPHETQAKLSMLLAVVGGLSALLLVVSVLWKFDFEEFAAVYLDGGRRYYTILGATALGVATGSTGFFVGLNSAGRRRNPLSNLAWTAFFLNAAVILVTLCMFVVFWFAREPVYRVTP